MFPRRLLLAVAQGGATFPQPPHIPTIRTVVSDAAYTWFGHPRAVCYGDLVYLGFTDTSGDVVVVAFDPATDTLGTPVVLHAALDVDDHVNPALMVFASTGKLGAWYCRHEPISTTMHQRISVSSLDDDPWLLDGFAAETDTDSQMGSTSYDYPAPKQLSSEAGKTRMFYRNIPFGVDYQLTQSESDDDGATWSGRDAVYRSNQDTVFGSTRGYWKEADNGVDQIHFALTSESPNTGATSLGHCYFDAGDGNYHETDGTTITLRGAAPLDVFWFIDVTLVYDGSTTRGWVWDIALDGATPVILFPTFPGYAGSGVASDHRANYARWNGSGWDVTEICATGVGIDATGVYSAGMCLDPDNPSIAWICRQDGGVWGLWKYTTEDNGATWSGTLIYSHATAKVIRPFVPKNHPVGFDVMVLVGTYTGYTSFNMALMVYG